MRACIIALCLAALPAGVPRKSTRLRESPSPVLTVADSVILAETDSQYVSFMAGFAISRGGRFYVSDKGNYVVHEYSPAGVHLRTIGRRGSRPGEFSSPANVSVDGDSLLVVNGGRGRVHVVDLRSGVQRWERQLETAPQPLIDLVIADGRVYANHLDSRTRTSSSSVGAAADSARRSGPFPQPFGRNQLIDQSFSWMRLRPFGRDSLAVAFEGTDYLFIGQFGRGGFDSLHIARTRRRGARPDVIERVAKDPRGAKPFVFAMSAPWAIGVLSGGRFAYVAIDVDVTNARASGVMYVSVIDVRRHKACVDARVPVPSDPQPRADFHGDTLVVASHEETAERRPRLIVRKFLLDTKDCRWVD